MNQVWKDVNLDKIAKKYETPLYVYNLNIVEDRINELNNVIEKYPNLYVSYASKAFLTVPFGKFMVKKSNFGMDGVSLGEIYVQLKAGLDPSKVLFHGNNKTEQEIKDVINLGVRNFVIDSFDEYNLLIDLLNEMNVEINALIRIAPSLDNIDTHKFITTANKDTKFGIPISSGDIEKIIETYKDTKINVNGFHFHIGSQLLTNSSHQMALDKLLDLINKYNQTYNYVPEVVNIGGGLGVNYVDEKRADAMEFLSPLIEQINQTFENNSWDLPTIKIEPGRWIVAESGKTLYSIGTIKEIKDVRTYISVDGGMNDNLRVSLYDSKYSAYVANKLDEENNKIVTIAGKNCESGDILIKDLKVPNSIERGDILAVNSTGAYHHSMMNNYNKLLNPAIVFTYNGDDYLTTKRQSLDDLSLNDVDFEI